MHNYLLQYFIHTTYWAIVLRLCMMVTRILSKWLQLVTTHIVTSHTIRYISKYIRVVQINRHNRSTNLQLPICQNGFQSIRCNPTLSISISKWSSERVPIYIAAFTTAVCHKPNARFMFPQNTPFPI